MQLALCVERVLKSFETCRLNLSVHLQMALFKFVRMAGDLLPPSLYVPYLEMLRGLSNGKQSASCCFNLLKMNGTGGGGGKHYRNCNKNDHSGRIQCENFTKEKNIPHCQLHIPLFKLFIPNSRYSSSSVDHFQEIKSCLDPGSGSQPVVDDVIIVDVL